MTRSVLLALGVLLSAGSQLRLAGLPVGPGEICLALWFLCSGVAAITGGSSPITPSLNRFLIFWTLFGLSLSLGRLTSMVMGSGHEDDPVHDALAYTLAAIVSCVSLYGRDAAARLRQTAWFLSAFGTVLLAIQVAHGFQLVAIPGVVPWYWDRFRGWSSNPNQLALVCAILLPISLHLAQTSRRLSGKLAGLTFAIAPVVVGRLTKSDTFVLTLLTVVTVMLGLRLWAWLTQYERHLTLRFAFAVLMILALPLVVASAIPIGATLAQDAESLAKAAAKDKGGEATANTASLRFSLWEQALTRGLGSGMLGMGPGPHLPRPSTVGEVMHTELNENTTEVRPMAKLFEAHSTPLDVLLQGGLLAVLSLCWLVGGAFAAALRARLDALVVLLFGLCVFSVTHFIVRHPIVWFALALVLAAGLERPRFALPRSRPRWTTRSATDGR